MRKHVREQVEENVKTIFTYKQQKLSLVKNKKWEKKQNEQIKQYEIF